LRFFKTHTHTHIHRQTAEETSALR
jgi:hypothetical protein